MKDLTGKRLLVLGGSIWKNAIKQFAEEHNIILIAAGLYPAGIDEIADEVYRIDTIDTNIMIPFIKEKKIDGVYMGGSELIISHSCKYINELGLPCYCTKKQWEALQDKAQFKELCVNCGLPVVPKYEITIENIESQALNIDFPVITKPTDGCGSSGFSICNNIEELKQGYKKAANDSPTGSVICEKFVKNDGVVVFYTFSNGKIIFSGLEDKFPVKYKKQGSFVGGLFVFESTLADEFRNKFETKIQQLISYLKIKEGSAWIEVFHDGDNYYFNEVGFRYGGSVSIYPVDYFHGINQVAADIYYALTGESMIIGHKSLIPPKFKRKKKYCIYPIHVKPGKIKSISGVIEVEKMENVLLLSLTKHEGDTIADTGSFSQALALVHFVCDDICECSKTIEKISDFLHIVDTNDNDMINCMLKMEFVKF